MNNHKSPNIALVLDDDQLDAGGYEKWNTEVIYCLPGCTIHFYSPDGIGRIFTGDEYDLAEMINDRGEKFVRIISRKSWE